VGEYSTTRTMIVTGLGAPDGDGCGAPQAPVAGQAMPRYRVASEGGRLRVTDLIGGCVLDAHEENGTVVADGTACSLPEQARLRLLGVTDRIYSLFRLSPRDKTVRTRTVTASNTSSGPTRSCSVSEEKIVGFR
jgi:hypothetical protein